MICISFLESILWAKTCHLTETFILPHPSICSEVTLCHSQHEIKGRKQKVEQNSHRRPTCIYLMLTICIGTCTHTGTQGKSTPVFWYWDTENKGSKGLGNGPQRQQTLPGLTTVFSMSPAPLGFIAQVTVGGQLSLAPRGARAPAVHSQSSLPFCKFLPSFVIPGVCGYFSLSPWLGL